MKKLVLPVFFLLVCLTQNNAQVDVQINPIGILFSSIDVSAEFPVSEDFGIEGALGYDFQNYDIEDLKYKNNAFGVRAIGKYYFNPEDGRDRWNIGGYLRFASGKSSAEDAGTGREEVKNTKFAVGFYTGYKWVSRKNVVFELGLGIGRNFVRTFEYEDGTEVDTSDIPLLNIDVLGRLSLGYRFGGSGGSGKK
ncbi:MAG: DUF3575 domain-containing protein [Lewinellaceae bacterium]|nr:DUF3575 domain-containing protein [Lewinellaceae bacterium]